MNVELRLSADDAQVIKDLWPLYQQDLSVFAVLEQGGSLDSWWRDPRSLFPYLITVDGSPAGFNLIAARSRIPAEIRADFVVHEFFVLRAYRGGPTAERAAVDGFDRHRGEWEVVTYPTHQRAIAFWRRVVGRYTTRYTEAEVDHAWGRRVAFRFNNAT